MFRNPYKTPDVVDAESTSTVPNVYFHLAVCMLATVGLNAMVAALMPSGLAGVPYSVFMLAIFVASFGLVAILERNVWINMASVCVFWLLAMAFHATNLGSAPFAARRFADGLWMFSGLAATHLSVQVLVNYSIGRNGSHRIAASADTSDNKAVNRNAQSRGN